MGLCVGLGPHGSCHIDTFRCAFGCAHAHSLTRRRKETRPDGADPGHQPKPQWHLHFYQEGDSHVGGTRGELSLPGSLPVNCRRLHLSTCCWSPSRSTTFRAMRSQSSTSNSQPGVIKSPPSYVQRHFWLPCLGKKGESLWTSSEWRPGMLLSTPSMHGTEPG